MATNKRRLTEAERDQRRARDRQRLSDACEQLLCSDGWQRWVRARTRNGLGRYSVSNLCLILLANPNASFVAGFKAWLELGYCVRKGEHAIWIFAPMPTRRRDQDPAAETDDEQRRVLFRAVPVFDRCQVDALDGREPAPLDPPSQPLTGDSHAHLIEPAAAFARSCGYSVAFETTPAGTGGWCDRPNQRIVVDADAPANAQLRIVIHETAHALGIDYQTYTRRQAEVMVDTITYIVCSGLGLAIDGESIPYVTGWGEDGALDAVNHFATTIDRLAREIENAIAAAAATTSR
jgi:antirestriction protein ArdC